MRSQISALFASLLACSLLAFSGGAQEKPTTTQDLLQAARKAQQSKGSKPPARRVYTNDNIPSASEVSEAAEPAQASGATAGGGSSTGSGTVAAGAAAAGGSGALNESQWRQKFAELRAKIATAEKEADLIQRERNLNEQQYYTNPNKALREQYTRDELNNQKAKIDAKKEEIARLKQQLADLEEELRKAGGPPAWAREQ